MRPDPTGPMQRVVQRVVQRFVQRLAAPLFPPACALCGAPGADLCAACDADLERPAHACIQCAMPLAHASDVPCGACLHDQPAYDRSIASTLYAAPFDQLVLDLKYRAGLAYAPLFAQRLARRIARVAAAQAGSSAWHLDRIVAVPLARARLARRGYNQALEIARPLARRLGVPLDADAVLRIRDTTAQAELPFETRRANMRGAFHAPGALDGLCIGVVDDVMTTGSTLEEVALALKRAGAARVVNLVVARTP